MAKNYLEAIELQSINSTTFTGAYQAINTDGLEHACSILRIVNDSTKDVTISYDGVTPHDYIRSGSDLTLNLQANASPNGYVSLVKKGTVVYVSATAGTGYVYLAGYYNPYI